MGVGMIFNSFIFFQEDAMESELFNFLNELPEIKLSLEIVLIFIAGLLLICVIGSLIESGKKS